MKKIYLLLSFFTIAIVFTACDPCDDDLDPFDYSVAEQPS